MKWELLWIALAILCILYGFAVLSTASGTGFWLVWIMMGLVSLICAILAHMHIWIKLPGIIRTVVLVLVVLGAALFLFVEARIVSYFRSVPEPGLDCLVVLGSQVRRGGPSAVLRYRLDAACDYLDDNPGTVCIVSGGQGRLEPFPEADGMRDYLVSRGIDESRILLERESGNTKENIEFSKKIIETQIAGSRSAADARIGIVTNNFHLYRACAIARKAGLANISPISADSTAFYLPNNMLREFLGVVKDRLAGNL